MSSTIKKNTENPKERSEIRHEHFRFIVFSAYRQYLCKGPRSNHSTHAQPFPRLPSSMYEFDEHLAGSHDSTLDLYVFLQRHLSKQRTSRYEHHSRFEVLNFPQVQLYCLSTASSPARYQRYGEGVSSDSCIHIRKSRSLRKSTAEQHQVMY